MSTTAIVVAAGSGSRLGSQVPKAFVALHGEALLVHAARAFQGLVDATVCVVAATWIDEATRLLTAAGLDDALVCKGGAQRHQSVRLGLDACPAGTDLVAVHDAARPLVDHGVIQRVLDAVGEGWDAVAPAVPLVDTLKLVDPDGMVVRRTVDRRNLWAVQTPQAFPLRVLLDARPHSGPDARDIVAAPGGLTDDLAAVERVGGRVHLVRGSRRNMKITHPEDLAIATALFPMELP